MSKTNTDYSPRQIIDHWLVAMTDSIKQRDLDAHMRLVNPRVQVYGMPSKAVIDYNEWRSRRQADFDSGELLSVNYALQRIITSMPRRITFTARETLLDKRNKAVILDKTITLEKEDDTVWRVVEETIKGWKVKRIELPK